MDPRHQRRIAIVQNLYALGFEVPDNLRTAPDEGYSEALEILKDKEEFYAKISKHAPKFPVNSLAKVDVSILLLAMYEITKKDHKQPVKVVINEAVELAKELGSEKSPAFINAILGAFIDSHEK
jgi:N utilization substance protein B